MRQPLTLRTAAAVPLARQAGGRSGWPQRDASRPEALDPQPVQTRIRLFGPYQSGGGAASLLRAIRRGMRARKASSPYDVTPSRQHQRTRQAANLRMQI